MCFQYLRCIVDFFYSRKQALTSFKCSIGHQLKACMAFLSDSCVFRGVSVCTPWIQLASMRLCAVRTMILVACHNHSSICNLLYHQSVFLCTGPGYHHCRRAKKYLRPIYMQCTAVKKSHWGRRLYTVAPAGKPYVRTQPPSRILLTDANYSVDAPYIWMQGIMAGEYGDGMGRTTTTVHVLHQTPHNTGTAYATPFLHCSSTEHTSFDSRQQERKKKSSRDSLPLVCDDCAGAVPSAAPLIPPTAGSIDVGVECSIPAVVICTSHTTVCELPCVLCRRPRRGG